MRFFNMMIHHAFAFLSLLTLTIAYILYLRGIFYHGIKPHMFSWLIWCILTGIAFFAQYTSGAGAGAFAAGYSSIISFFIFILSLFKGEKHITKSDYVALSAALISIPIWRMTHQPLYAIIMITCIELFAFWPTFRKTWIRPYQESISLYILSAIKSIFVLLALQDYNWVTVLYPFALIFTNGIFAALVMYRRKQLAQ